MTVRFFNGDGHRSANKAPSRNQERRRRMHRTASKVAIPTSTKRVRASSYNKLSINSSGHTLNDHIRLELADFELGPVCHVETAIYNSFKT